MRRQTLPVKFFRTAAKREPVREWLRSLPRNERKAIGDDIRTLQFGWPVGMPLVRKIEEGLWEVRTRLPNRISRVMFTVVENEGVLLHGFIKRGQKTPQEDLSIARQRKAFVQKDRSHGTQT